MTFYNWHKRWPLRDLLCRLERHDYEVEKLSGNDVVLQCFYCGHRRRCMGAARDDIKDRALDFVRLTAHHFGAALEDGDDAEIHFDSYDIEVEYETAKSIADAHEESLK